MSAGRRIGVIGLGASVVAALGQAVYQVAQAIEPEPPCKLLDPPDLKADIERLTKAKGKRARKEAKRARLLARTEDTAPAAGERANE